MTHLIIWSIASASLLLGPPDALAHDWYPLSCCSEKDCHALLEEKGEIVTETAEGWKLWDGRLIARDVTKLSPDQHFHLCETPAKAILCFFAPPGAS
jgi:hypothetical protein